MRIEETAPAKVNLTLEVLGRRADGLHELRSLVAFASDRGDRLTLDTSRPAGFSVEGPLAAAIVGENLIGRALAATARAEPRLLLGHVVLDKRLPVAAGIGGGSADAVAVLRAVRRANSPLAEQVDWTAIAGSLGSDVTVCLACRPSLMQGTGERLSPIRLPGQLAAVLVNPMVVVPVDKTARVFRTLGLVPGTLAQGLRAQPTDFPSPSDLLDHMRATGNVLTEPAKRVVPMIGDVLGALEGSGSCLFAQLSGAGPTCFGIYPDMSAAHEAAGVISARHPAWWVAPTRLG